MNDPDEKHIHQLEQLLAEESVDAARYRWLKKHCRVQIERVGKQFFWRLVMDSDFPTDEAGDWGGPNWFIDEALRRYRTADEIGRNAK